MKRAFTLIEVLIVVAVVAIAAAILWPVFARSRNPGRRTSCQSNLKQIGLGFMQYVQDYDERLPAARFTSTTGWADVLQPYTKSTQLFQCPQGQSPNTNAEFSIDYFYNRRLSRAAYNKLKLTAWTIMAGDGDDNAPSWNSWMVLPPDAATNSGSPSQRHLGAANYLFADGHVKALKPDRITTNSPKNGTSEPTFAVR